MNKIVYYTKLISVNKITMLFGGQQLNNPVLKLDSLNKYIK